MVSPCSAAWPAGRVGQPRLLCVIRPALRTHAVLPSILRAHRNQGLQPCVFLMLCLHSCASSVTERVSISLHPLQQRMLPHGMCPCLPV